METLEPLDKFGKFLVENLRDKSINFAEKLLASEWKAPGLQDLQNDLQSLSAKQKQVFIGAIIESIDTGIHDFLFALQEQADFDNEIQVIVDGENVVELSDGIHGEAYSDEGWYAKYSKYKTKE
jgi:hypothetical protein